MTTNQKIKLLTRANLEFQNLSKKSECKAKVYRGLDFVVKILLAFGGALITYFSDDPKNVETVLKAIGIVIASLTAISSIFTFEKRSLSNMQVHSKCLVIIPEIEDKIESLNRGNDENIQEYIRKTFKELSILNIASFTDTVFEKIASQRQIDT